MSVDLKKFRKSSECSKLKLNGFHSDHPPMFAKSDPASVRVKISKNSLNAYYLFKGDSLSLYFLVSVL